MKVPPRFTHLSLLLENDPNRMNNSGEEEEQCENEVYNDVHVARLLFQEDGQRWDEDCQDDEKKLLIIQRHRVSLVCLVNGEKSFTSKTCPDSEIKN